MFQILTIHSPPSPPPKKRKTRKGHTHAFTFQFIYKTMLLRFRFKATKCTNQAIANIIFLTRTSCTVQDITTFRTHRPSYTNTREHPQTHTHTTVLRLFSYLEFSTVEKRPSHRPSCSLLTPVRDEPTLRNLFEHVLLLPSIREMCALGPVQPQEPQVRFWHITLFPLVATDRVKRIGVEQYCTGWSAVLGIGL